MSHIFSFIFIRRSLICYKCSACTPLWAGLLIDDTKTPFSCKSIYCLGTYYFYTFWTIFGAMCVTKCRFKCLLIYIYVPSMYRTKMFSWDWCSCQITRDKWNGTVCITACVLQLSLALAITNQCFVCTACYTSKLLENEQKI